MNRWAAEIARNRKVHTLGYFDREEDAALAYDVAAARFYGELIRSNETLGLYGTDLTSPRPAPDTARSERGTMRSVGLYGGFRRGR